MDIQNKLMVRFPEKPMLMLFRLFSITVIKCCLTKSSWGKKGLCTECFMRGNIGRNSEQSTCIRSWNRGHGIILLSGLLPLACSICFLIYPRTTIGGWLHPQYAWLFHPNHYWRNDPITSQLNGNIFFNWGCCGNSFLQYPLRCQPTWAWSPIL